MAVAAWVAGAAYVVGNIRRATTSQPSGLFFKVTAVSGSSPYNAANSEPDWPTNIGSEVVDGQITWTAINSIYEDLSVLAPDAIIELFELHPSTAIHGTNTVYRWHNENIKANITWAGQPYSSQPIKAEGFEYKSGQGTLPRPTLSVDNTSLSISSLLLLVNETTAGNDLGGAIVKRIRTIKKYLDGESAADPNVQFPVEIWYVDRKSHEDRFSVSFELASKFDKPNQKLPKRQILANVCQWAYRSSECGYTGSNYWNVNDQQETSLANDKCGKRLSSCRLRFTNDLPFGSFPGAGNIR